MRRARSVAFRNAARVMKETGCGAIKIEGGAHMAETIRYLTDRGIPVMSHIGMTPQAVNMIGSFKPRGRFRSEWAAFEEDARAVAEAGAFAVVLEALAELLAARITKQISIPTIGIGASAECDGQILVLEDMLGLEPTRAEIRQGIRADRRGHRDRGKGLRERGSRPRVPVRRLYLSDVRRACTSHEKAQNDRQLAASRQRYCLSLRLACTGLTALREHHAFTIRRRGRSGPASASGTCP